MGQISDDGQIAYDIHQMIRHALALNPGFSPANWTEDYREPIQYGSEPLCQIEKLKIEEEEKQ